MNCPPIEAPPVVVMSEVPTRVGRCTAVRSIQCTASVIDNFATQPVVMWLGPDGQVVDEDSLLNYDSSDGQGEFVCRACANVASVGIVDHCFTTSVSIVDTSESTQH